MLTELGIISKDKQGVYIISSMIIDLRNFKMKAEDNITVIESKESKFISNDYKNVQI